VVPPPTARGSIVCVRRACTLDGRSSVDQIGVTKWTWEFGDGTSGSGQSMAHTYPRNGSFVVRLTVATARGATATRQDTVAVVDGTPVTRGSATCTGWTCVFDASASTDDGQITRYVWVFPDGAIVSGSG